MFAATKKIVKGPTFERASPTVINLRRRFSISALLPRTAADSPTTALQRFASIAPSPGLFARCSYRQHPRPFNQPQAAVITSLATTAPDMLTTLSISKLIAAVVALGTGVLSAIAWLDAKRKTQKPGLQYTLNEVRLAGRHDGLLRYGSAAVILEGGRPPQCNAKASHALRTYDPAPAPLLLPIPLPYPPPSLANPLLPAFSSPVQHACAQRLPLPSPAVQASALLHQPSEALEWKAYHCQAKGMTGHSGAGPS